MLVLPLGSCSPPAATIRAEVRGNALVFTASVSQGPLPFSRHTVHPQPDLVRVDHGGRIVWRIERKRDRRCLDGAPSSVFPLTYGKLPDCFVEIVRPRPLAAGTVYRIAAVGARRDDDALGYFRMGRTADNLDSEPAGLARWGEVESTYNVAASPDNGAAPPAR